MTILFKMKETLSSLLVSLLSEKMNILEFSKLFLKCYGVDLHFLKHFNNMKQNLWLFSFLKKFGEKKVRWQKISARLIFGSFVSPKLNSTKTFDT